MSGKFYVLGVHGRLLNVLGSPLDVLGSLFDVLAAQLVHWFRSYSKLIVRLT